ncbi:coilin-like [Dendronephthya gigantea]|uniref:coilin-like n=1 Tax=Dendronephthya gigantea TaxID=151771 RepID=UPI00106C4C19|nr:coilin-like [Dendronephthya gigantea]
MSSIRVRLIFERPLVKNPEQCWMLVDRNSCKIVRDLEYLIAKKFFVSGHTILDLYLDHFLLPSQEKIDVIRDNDVISVIEDKSQISNNEIQRKTSIKEKIKNSKKRKCDDSSDLKRKIKKAKHSSENNTDSEKLLDLHVVAQAKSDLHTTKDSVVNKMGKNKSKENAVGKNSMLMESLRIEAKGKLRKYKKKQKKTTLKGKDKSVSERLNNFWEKVASGCQQWNPSFGGKKTAEKEAAQTVSNGGKDIGVILEETSDKAGVENGTASQIPENNYDLFSKRYATKETTNKAKNDIPRTNQGSHIRFDNDEDESTDLMNNAVQPMIHPRVLTIREAEIPTSNNTPNLSPIEPDNPHLNFSTAKPANAKDVVGNRTGGSGKKPKRGKGDHRKDSYTNKSLILESTRVWKDGQTKNSQPATVNVSEKDFSSYPLLHGPPRVGDTIAFKMIELSQSYTPEISRYKEGKVLSFDSPSQVLKLKLTKESLTKVKGDGHVSSKFEIFDNDIEDEEVMEEIQDEVELQWTSMIETRLVDCDRAVS